MYLFCHWPVISRIITLTWFIFKEIEDLSPLHDNLYENLSSMAKFALNQITCYQLVHGESELVSTVHKLL